MRSIVKLLFLLIFCFFCLQSAFASSAPVNVQDMNKVLEVDVQQGKKTEYYPKTEILPKKYYEPKNNEKKASDIKVTQKPIEVDFREADTKK